MKLSLSIPALTAALLLALAPLSACKAGEEGKTSEDAITRLEEEGKLPVLDRSDDLAGPDEDDNGIRDDIDVWIAMQGYSSKERAAVEQLARASQEAVAFSGTSAEAKVVAEKINRGESCVSDQFDNFEEYLQVSERLEQFSANTRSRIDAYLRYNALLDGTTSPSIPKGMACDD